MTSTTALASRPAIPTLLTTAAQAAATPGAAAGAGRSTGASAARGAASPVLAARTAASGGTTASRAKASAAKKTTAKKPAAGKAPAAKAGYAKTTLAPEYAFLRDPKISLEEKLSRFIGLVMAKSEKDLLAQMEKMSPGSKAGASSSTAGASGTSGTSGASTPKAPKKAKGFSIWGALKVVLPQVGIATKVLGDATVKKLVQQLSGPVLAAAATAIGMPQLAPVALQAGKALGAIATDDGAGTATGAGAAIGGFVSSLTGAAAGAAGAIGAKATNAAATTTKAASGASGSTPSAGSTGAPQGGMADQLELQRLMERQKETFSILSNILRMNHEARMTSIQNLR